MSILPTFDRRLFTVSVARFWSPHAGRNFLPSAAAALGCSKADRGLLGGWATKGSDVYSCRTAEDHQHSNIGDMYDTGAQLR